MKIFKLIPDTVVEYIDNQEAFPLSRDNYVYVSGFSYHIKNEGPSPLVTVDYEIKYTTEEMETKVTYLPNNVVQYQMVSDETNEEIIIYFKSTCAFQFESDHFDADVITLIDFLSNHYQFVLSFISNRLPPSILKLEADVRITDTIERQADLLIENLRLNNVYNF